MRTSSLAVLLLAAASCSSPTSLRVQIEGAPGVALTSATVSIFDPYGIIGKKQLVSPALPGVLSVGGLADRAVALRIAVVGTTSSLPLLGWTRASIVPHAVTTVTVQLGNTPDSDNDGVPDNIDDCPTVPDPTQANSVGSGPGDACRNVADLAVPVDLASGAAVDLAAADLATAPPDLAPGPSLCASAGALFCDGFEAGTLAAPWGPFTTQGGITVDNAHVYRGSWALHAHQSAIGSGSSATGVAIATMTYPSPDVYLRAWAYLPSPAPTGTFTFLRAQQSGNGQYSVDLQVSGDALATNASRVAVAETSTFAPPLDRWFCVEWQLHLATSGYTIVKIDGNPVAGLQAANTFDDTNSPNYDWLVVGLDSGSAAGGIPARDLWLDEIIFDNKPIGCAR